MGGHTFPEVFCKVCGSPVDLTVDLSADEDGHAVHEKCYLRRIIQQTPQNRDAPAPYNLTLRDCASGLESGKRMFIRLRPHFLRRCGFFRLLWTASAIPRFP